MREAGKAGLTMWTSIYMAQSRGSVLKVKELLDASGIPACVRPIRNGGAGSVVQSAARDSDDGYYELLVPETEAQLAHTILIENGY